MVKESVQVKIRIKLSGNKTKHFIPYCQAPNPPPVLLMKFAGSILSKNVTVQLQRSFAAYSEKIAIMLFRIICYSTLVVMKNNW